MDRVIAHQNDADASGLRAAPRKRLAVHVLSAVVLTLALVFWVRQLDLSQLAFTLKRAQPLPLVLVALLAFAELVFKARFWFVALSALRPVNFRALLRYGLAAAVGSMLAPGRAGEPLRLWILRVRHGVPYSETLAVAGLEKLGDIGALVLLVLPLPWLVPQLSAAVRPSVLLLSSVPVAAAVAIGYVRRHPRWSKLPRFVGLRLFDRPSTVAIALSCVFLAWAADLATIELVLLALDARPSWRAGLMVLLITNLAVAVPITPGNVGAHELGSALALKMLGVEAELATAFALLYHALHTLPVLLVGLPNARRLLLVPPAVASAPAA